MGRTMVAVDLGGSNLRAVQFTLGKNAPTFGKAGSVPLPAGAVEGGEVKDVEAVTKALKDLWAKEKFSSKQVVFGLANSNVLVRQMDVDWLPADEFGKALKHQVADYVTTMSVDDANLAYHPLAEYDVNHPDGTVDRKTRILLVAAAAEMVKRFADAIQGAGLQPVKADLVPFALIRAANPQHGAPDAAEAVIDMGADVTNVVIHQGGQPRFVRIVAGQAGRYLTHTLMETYQWSFEDAERSKIELGLASSAPLPGPNGSSVFGGEEPAVQQAAAQHPAQQIINQVVSAFIGEIRQSVDFFLSSTSDINTISRVVLTGGGGNIKGLAQRLSSELRVPVEYGAPIRVAGGKSQVPDGVSEQQMSVAVGLALGAGAA